MREVQEPISYTATKYMAEDGQIFISKTLCEKHEKEVKVNQIVASLPTKKVDGSKWYQINSREEFDAWLEFEHRKTYINFDRRIEEYCFSKNWYRLDCYYESRYDDTLYRPESLPDKIESLNYYIEEAQSELYNFQKEWNDAP